MFSLFKKRSFNARLLLVFIVTSIIPIIFVNVFFYINSSNIVIQNNNEVTMVNLQQTSASLNAQLESYEDILYQIYTNDQIVSIVDKINSEENVIVAKKQLRNILSDYIYTKQFLKSIIIITKNNYVIFYDQLTGSTTNSSWIENIGTSTENLYEYISSKSTTSIIPTKFAFNFANKSVYLFFEGHRLIDYSDVEKSNGIALICIDEAMIKDICIPSLKDNQESDKLSNFNFIVDQEGYIVTYVDPIFISKKTFDMNMTEEQKINTLSKFVKESYMKNKGSISINVYYDDKYKWYIVNASDQSKAVEKLNNQQRILTITVFLSSITLTCIIIFLTKHLTKSIKKVVSVMNKAGGGDLSVRVEMDKNMPAEIEMIASDFNKMLGQLDESIRNEKEANDRQRNAEIKALEAQINPHFLYNTLDTINWMAIDNNQYDISNTISSLAYILRYGIDNSNAIVPIKEEVEWLKKYIFLQQSRLKNACECNIKVSKNAQELKIHKLLFQPFVENAILHGFEGVERAYKLDVRIHSEDDYLIIEIHDNGKGIEPELVEKINSNIFADSLEKSHIGMQNAISRIHMYYGERTKVYVKSILGKGTTVNIYIPSDGKDR